MLIRLDLEQTVFRPLAFVSERSLFRVFLFLLIFSQGPIREYFIHRLAPGFQTTTTFCSLIQIQRNQCPLLRYDPLYPVIQLKHVSESLKFELDQILIQTSFDRNLSFITPFELFLFAKLSS